MTSPDSLAIALLNHAEGSRCMTAAAELLIAQAWLGNEDFASRFITVHRSPGGGQPVAVIDWPAVVTALGTSLPCSGGEQRMLKITASLADGIPVDLRDTLAGLDDHNVQLLIAAIRHASGNRTRSASIDIRFQFREVGWTAVTRRTRHDQPDPPQASTSARRRKRPESPANHMAFRVLQILGTPHDCSAPHAGRTCHVCRAAHPEGNDLQWLPS